MTKQVEICKTCAFFDTRDGKDGDIGLCRFNAPRFFITSDLQLRDLEGSADVDPKWGHWPKVTLDDWCGAWKPIDKMIEHPLQP